MKYKYNNQWKDLNVKVSDTYPIGAIAPYGGETAPTNWLICDGSAVSRTTYSDLFNVIGTSFGAGDGSTTFNLPDLRSRVPLGKDSRDEDFDTIGETYGEKKHTLTINEMPRHEHTLSAGFNNEGAGSYTNAKYKGYSQTETVSYGLAEAQGGSQAHNIVQPSLVTNYIIKAFQSAGVVGNVAKSYTESDTDTYNCKYINNIDSKFDYSEEEKIIGKDTDGSNIYKRTFKGTLGNGDFTVITNLYNNTNIILKNAYGSLRKEGSGAIEIGSYVNGTFYSGLYVHQEEIQCYHGSGVRGGTYDITLEFKKIEY